MSSGSPFYHFVVCNMCSFPVSHSTNIFVSFSPWHHGPAMCYPHVLSAALFHSPLMNLLPVHLFTSRSMEPIPQVFRYVCISCQVAHHLPPHTRVWPKGSPPWDSLPPLHPHSTSAAKGVATGSTFFFKIYSWQQHHRDRGANKCCIFGQSHSLS